MYNACINPTSLICLCPAKYFCLFYFNAIIYFSKLINQSLFYQNLI